MILECDITGRCGNIETLRVTQSGMVKKFKCFQLFRPNNRNYFFARSKERYIGVTNLAGL